jgi:hypothetical protein
MRSRSDSWPAGNSSSRGKRTPRGKTSGCGCKYAISHAEFFNAGQRAVNPDWQASILFCGQEQAK